MELNSPDTWRWIWFSLAAIFVLCELFTPATFFFLPFGIGALVAGIAAALGWSVNVEWILFVVVSVVVFAGMWPLARRLEQADGEQEGVGATRWVGQEARVVEAIAENGYGTVRLEREVWRAESMTGEPVRAGTAVLVTKIAGTRLIVVPVDDSIDHSGPAQLEPDGQRSWPS